jgi:hypothetical protein
MGIIEMAFTESNYHLRRMIFIAICGVAQNLAEDD